MVSCRLVETYKFFRYTYVHFLFLEDKGNTLFPSDGTHLPCCMASYPEYRNLGNFAVDINRKFNRNQSCNFGDENNVVG